MPFTGRAWVACASAGVDSDGPCACTAVGASVRVAAASARARGCVARAPCCLGSQRHNMAQYFLKRNYSVPVVHMVSYPVLVVPTSRLVVLFTPGVHLVIFLVHLVVYLGLGSP